MNHLRLDHAGSVDTRTIITQATHMKRRTFIGTMGTGAAFTLAPGLLKGAGTPPPPALRVLSSSGRALGFFPNVTGPRMALASDGAPAVLR